MVATKKPAKRSAAKKRPAAKPQSSRKKVIRKRAKRGTGKTPGPKVTRLKRRARKGLTAARGGLDSVLQAGEKTWRTLKSTTAQVVEGVKETLAGEQRSSSRRPKSQ